MEDEGEERGQRRRITSSSARRQGFSKLTDGNKGVAVAGTGFAGTATGSAEFADFGGAAPSISATVDPFGSGPATIAPTIMTGTGAAVVAAPAPAPAATPADSGSLTFEEQMRMALQQSEQEEEERQKQQQMSPHPTAVPSVSSAASPLSLNLSPLPSPSPSQQQRAHDQRLAPLGDDDGDEDFV